MSLISTLSNSEKIASLYVGYYSRAADPLGFDFWKGVLDGGSLSLEAIAAGYASQIESTSNYPYLANPSASSPSTFVISVFLNVFNRFPDSAGLNFWSAQLANGYPVGEFILAVMGGAQNSAAGQDATTLRNKIGIAEYWKDKAAATAGFTLTPSSPEREEARATVAAVTSTAASVTAAKARADAYFAAY